MRPHAQLQFIPPESSSFPGTEVVAEATQVSSRLSDDPQSVRVLYCSQESQLDDRATVGIVGTRRATPYGRRVAWQLAKELTNCGINVVSGLAKGIDAAAHEGALAAINNGAKEAQPVAVVAGGIDCVYPRQNAPLWRSMREKGIIISEYPMGTPTERWRFPERNRIIAALSDVLVVVESTARSGTRHTVESAQQRDRMVLAVPGPITSPQSEGTNQLLREGAAPVLDVDDVLIALSLVRPDLPVASPQLSMATQVRETIQCLSQEEAELFTFVDVEPLSLATISERAQAPFLKVARLLESLRRAGVVANSGDYWVRA